MRWAAAGTFLGVWMAAAVAAAAIFAPPGQEERSYPYPKKEIWDACMELLRWLPLEEADFEKGKIATQWLTRDEVTHHFLLLGSAAQVRSRYFFKVEGEGGSATVRVWSRHEIQKYAGMQGLRRQYRESDGKGEKEFLRQIQEQLEKKKLEP